MIRIAIVILAVMLAPQSTPQTPPVQQMPAPGTPRWEPPDPKNLQVLPKDIPKPQLVQTMRSFAMGLGVRCEHCHLGEGPDLTKFDFASDAKLQKAVARKMMAMAREINTTLLAGFPPERDPSTPAVTCYTCHRGQTKPLIARPAEPGKPAAPGEFPIPH